MNNVPISEVEKHKHLGLIINKTCQWGDHIDSIIQKVTPKINILRSLKFTLDRKSLETLYFSFIRPTFEYANIIWDNCPDYYKNKLEQINIEAGRIITGATKLVSIRNLYMETGWETLEQRREKSKLIQYFKILNGLTPEYLQELLPPQHRHQHTYNTRNANDYVQIICRTTHHFNSFFPSATRLWNNLPLEIKQIKSLPQFKSKLSSSKKIPSYYYSGTRIGQILHARLRMNCSSLKQHLFQKKHRTRSIMFMWRN